MNGTIFPANAVIGHLQVQLANETRFNEANFLEPVTAYAAGWRDDEGIEDTLDFLAPPVPVPRRFTYAEWLNAEAFLSDLTGDEDIRGIGADFKRVEYKSTKTNGAVENKGLTMRLDLDQVPEMENWQRYYTAKLMKRLLRTELRRAVTLASGSATNTAKTWDTTAGKDPDQDVDSDLVTAQTSSGVRPNRVLYGDTAWSKRRLSHRAQSTAGGYASAAMTPDEVAQYLGLDGVRWSRERYQSGASAKTEIVNNLVLMIYGTKGADTEDPSNLKRFVAPTSSGRFRVYGQQVAAKLFDLTVEHYSLIKVVTSVGLRKFTVS